jgi:hypothetical protein
MRIEPMSRNDRMWERSFGSFKTRCEALGLSRSLLARGFENDWYENWDMVVLLHKREEKVNRRRAFLDLLRFRLNEIKSGEG